MEYARLLLKTYEFFMNFDYRDVMEALEPIFPLLFEILSEKLNITEEEDLRYKIFLIFWFISRDKKNVQKFLDVIKVQYYWLVKDVQNDDPELERFTSLLKQMRNDDQNHARYNVRRIKPFMKLYDELLKMKNFDIIILIGDLGVGKKWLARDVCQTKEIIDAMNSHIFWLDVSNCVNEAEDVRMLNQLLILVDNRFRNSSYPQDNLDLKNTKVTMQQCLREHFLRPEYRECLVILANVRNIKTIETFNLGCKILAITRKKLDTHEYIMMDPQLTRMEFKCLLTSYNKDIFEALKKANCNDAEEIYNRSSGHPYLLNIIGQSLRQGNSVDVLKKWKEDLLSPSESVIGDKLGRAVKSYLAILPEYIQELFKKLYIFPHNVPIPTKLLEVLWNRSPNEIIRKLSDRFILTETKDSRGDFVVNISIVYRMILNTNDKSQEDTVTYHKMIIDYYKLNDFDKKRMDHYCHLQHDLYFYNNIIYHLQNAKQEHLIIKLLKDYGYVEQKMRAIGLLNTLVDINHILKSKDIDCNQHDREFLKCLLNFLPKMEEKILHSSSCLLQNALNYSDRIGEEAECQIKSFRDRVWFTDKSSFRQTRQIVSLTHKASIVKLLEPDMCLVVTDHCMSLLHTSIKNNHGENILIEYNDYNASILDVHIRDNGNYLFTRDSDGVLKIWNIKDAASHDGKKILTNIPSNIKDVDAMYIEEGSLNLHVALVNGDIYFYKWNENEHRYEGAASPLRTNQKSIKFLTKVCGKYYMVIDLSGQLYFWKTRDYSSIENTLSMPHEEIIYYKTLETSDDKCANIVLVSSNHVYLLQIFDNCIQDSKVIYECDKIVCAALSQDEQYLILGQKQTCLVFDMKRKMVSLRRNVSDGISSVDVDVLNDKVFKYAIVCAIKQKSALHLYGLREARNNTIAWAHERTDDREDQIIPQLEPFVSLLGGNLYDMRYEGGIFLVAVDSQNRIHQIRTNGIKENSTTLPPVNSGSITAITTNKQNTFFGGENGKIYYINNRIFSERSSNSINYLHLVNQKTLISGNTNGEMFIYNIKNGKYFSHDFNVNKTYELASGYLICIDDSKRQLLILDAVDYTTCATLKFSDKLQSSAYQNSYLYLAGESKICMYDFSNYTVEDNAKLFEIRGTSTITKAAEKTKLCCLAVNRECNLMALGRSDGLIMLFKLDNKRKEITQPSNLKSHANAICDMKFSPNSEVLVSCADSLCFWNVGHVLNNPDSPKKTSSRFTSQSSIDPEEVDAQLVKKPEMHIENSYPTKLDGNDIPRKPYNWSNKRGSKDAPELFACLKFDGNNAEQIFVNAEFTQFNTIDNEGVFYQYNPFDIPESEIPTQSESPSSLHSFEEDSSSTEESCDLIGTDIAD